MSWWRRADCERLIPYDEALAALGSDGSMGRYDDEIPLEAIVGSVARSDDYDSDFASRHRDRRTRRAEEQLREGRLPPPIDVVRLGQIYFVVDGHHRVAAAKAQGWSSLPARVHRICTVAYARCCLRLGDLRRKAAERTFREVAPLPEPLAEQIDLGSPADWHLLTERAEEWAATAGSSHGCCSHELAAAWWEAEVVPIIRRLRSDGSDMLDLGTMQEVVAALGRRDGIEPRPDEANLQHACCRA